MAGIEQFTVMAVLDAQDRISRVIEKVTGTVDEFTKTMDRAAEQAKIDGQIIDDSLLQTASGADALALANDRVVASEARLKQATKEQADAEQQLMGARAQGLGDEELIRAADDLAIKEREAAKASTELKDAKQAEADVTKTLAGNTWDLSAAETSTATVAEGLPGILLGVGLAVATVAGLSVKAAGDYQSLATHLVTDAGEAPGQLQKISDGMLKIAVNTGIAATKVAQGMYHIESSGFHGTDALNMATTAAEGAQVGGADFDTVTKALAGTMVDYAGKGWNANQMMNALIETTAQGDLHMQDLTTTLGNVTPLAAAAGLSYDQVGGAIATMTDQNMTAAQATQNYAHLIQSLSRPNNVQIQEMQHLGITQQQVADSLQGPDGMVHTLNLLTGAVASHTKNGQVFINTLNDSENASKAATVMYNRMSPPLKKYSDELINGKMSSKEYLKAVSEMDPASTKQGKQFLTLKENSEGFNKMLANGSADSQTFNGALADLTGGQVGLRTALMLSTDSGTKFANASKAIADAATNGKDKVLNWDAIQGTFNVKVDKAKAALEVFAITVGTKMIPWVEKAIGIIMKAVDWIEKNKKIVELLSVALGTVLVAALVIIAGMAAVFIGALVILGGTLYSVYQAIMYLWHGLEYLGEKIADLAIGIKNKLVAGLQEVFDWFMGIPGQFSSIGDGIINGIASGIENGWSWLETKVSNLGSSLLKAAMDAIHIGSPSRDFADHVGKWIPYGIAAGVDEHAHVAHRSVSNLASSLTGTATGSMGIGLSAVGAGGAGGGSVVIDMRGSQLMSDRDMDVFVDRIGRRLATRVLPAGGVRIRS